MTRVLWALAPIAASSVYFFGWRALLLLVVVNAAAFAAEYAFTRRWKQPASAAVFVSGTLFALSLPPQLPVGMAVLGIVFGIVFGKMVFGGFGKNIFNPALTGRAFIYVSFGRHMTGQWVDPVEGSLGGFGAYAADAVTQATPCMALKAGEAVPLLHLLLGTTSGVLGGTSALLVLLGGSYLVWKKAANHRIVVGCLAGYLVMQAIFWSIGCAGVASPLHGLLAGSVLFGIFFYATDPVSGPTTQQGRWIYGAFIGSMSSLITVFSAWPEGTMFAILLANMFAPIMDHAIKAVTVKKK
ncbi:MAG: RnfABCDGE type electron transport complex subunit D [Verrucomicrobia bacterium]|nr:RnfABCDGE type electron transport complex subunit D [Verrucomicrobiota bacterium]MBT7067308.1 RnfABCDGE type electron transport complex subunit D [Verrucomicrobiota bacterium]MBT7699493.1 RnfABCDGE type electron transport complex subunit D [Verrucomicrobiota bacterium]